MDTTNVSPASITASNMAMTQASAGVSVLRKIVDNEAAQGALLVKMMDQAAGVGRSVDISA
ncbi:MAG TPA: putative motility protein [Holophaga sp.]|nr:putative motility protein [Holophaga sp.]